MPREGLEHVLLKQVARKLLRRLGAVRIVEEGRGKVDVAGQCRGVWIAFECGQSSELKIEALRTMYDIVVHLPYCYTPKLSMPLDNLEGRLDHKIIAWRCNR